MDLIRAYACGLLPDFDMCGYIPATSARINNTGNSRTYDRDRECNTIRNEFIRYAYGGGVFFENTVLKHTGAYCLGKKSIQSARELCNDLLAYYEKQQGDTKCSTSP